MLLAERTQREKDELQVGVVEHRLFGAVWQRALAVRARRLVPCCIALLWSLGHTAAASPPAGALHRAGEREAGNRGQAGPGRR